MRAFHEKSTCITRGQWAAYVPSRGRMVAAKVDVDGRLWINTRDVSRVMYGDHIPEIEKFRRYYGRNINTGVIEEALLAATFGHMRDLTDLSYETLRNDPHMASVVGKRVRAVGSVPPKVLPRSGDGIDADEANRWADMVRRQLLAIPRLKQRIINLAWASFYARAALETEWRETRNSGERWVIKDLHWIHPRRLSLGPERELRVRDDLFYGQGFEKKGFDLRDLPFKFITSRRQLFNDYLEREGLAPPCLYYAYFKRFSWRERLTLMELFGKPWRWVEVTEGANIQVEDIELARQMADSMGANNSAAMPAGSKLNMGSIGQNAGQIHKETTLDCNDEISKLVLGSTRTTDGKADGLGGEQARVHQDSELLVFTTDCDEIAEDLTEGLARAIVLLNGGPEAADKYTPKIELPFEIPPDPTEEIDRTKAVLSIPKIKLKEDQVYERIGFDKPEPGDKTIEGERELSPFDRPFDRNDRKEEGVDAAPTQKAAVITVDELREKQGFPPWPNPEEGAMTVSEFEARKRTRGEELGEQGAIESNGSDEEEAEMSVTPSDTGDQRKELERLGMTAWRSGRVQMARSRKQVVVGGITVHIDRPKGFVQTGTAPDGTEWERTYQVDYGFIPRTEGGDGEALDVFVGPNSDADTVWWVKQRKADGSFDEYKLFVGFDSASEVIATYEAHIPRNLFASMTTTTVEQVKALIGMNPREKLRGPRKEYGDHLTEQRVRRMLVLVDSLRKETEV